MVAAAFTAVTHPVRATPDERQAQAAELGLGQRFCRGVLRRAGRVERDAGVPYLDARLASRGLLADFDVDADRLGAGCASAVGEHVRQYFMESQLEALDLRIRHIALPERGGEPLASAPYLVTARDDGERFDVLVGVNSVLHRLGDGGPLGLGTALEHRDQLVDAGGLEAHHDLRVGADEQHHLPAALLHDLGAFEQRADPDRREELEVGQVNDDAFRRGDELFEFVSDRFSARDVEAAHDDDLAQVVADVGMTDGHDAGPDSPDDTPRGWIFALFPPL